MKTVTIAWAATLAVMSMQGQLTTAEAAPDQSQPQPQRPKYYFPRHIKRTYPNTTLARSSSTQSSTSGLLGSLLNPVPSSHFNPEPLQSIVEGLFPPPPSVESQKPVPQAPPVTSISQNTTQSPDGTSESSGSGSTSELTSSANLPSTSSESSTESSSQDADTRILQSIDSSQPVPSLQSPSQSTNELGGSAITSGLTAGPTAGSTQDHSSVTTRTSTRHGLPLSIPILGTGSPLAPLFPLPTDSSTSVQNTGSRSPESTTTPTSSHFNPVFGSTGGLPTITVAPIPATSPPTSKTRKSRSKTKSSFDTGSSDLPLQSSGTGSAASSDIGFGSTGGTVGESVNPTASTRTGSDFGAMTDEPNKTGSRPLLVGLSTILGGLIPPSSTPTSQEETEPSSTLISPTDAVNITSPAVPITTPSGSEDISSIVSSAQSEISSAASSVLSDISQSINVTAPIATDPSAALSSIASSLSKDLSSIAATATDPRVSSSLAVEFSSILSNAASSLATELSNVPTVSATVTGDVPVNVTSGGYIPDVTPGLPTPTSQSGNSTSGEGPDITPAPITTSSLSSTDTATSANASSLTASSLTASPTSTENSTALTSIPLTSGVTITSSQSSISTPKSTSSVPVSSVTAPITKTSTLSSETSAVSGTSSNETTPATIITQPSTTAVEASTTITFSSSYSTLTTPTPVVTPTPTSVSRAPTSIIPTGSDTATVLVVPSSIALALTTTPEPTATDTSDVGIDTSTTSVSTGMPTTMPRLIQPPGGMPSTPVNATLIQVGFNYGLNFPFVFNTNNSASQIFTFLPKGIANAINVSEEKVVMNALVPFDTTATLRFITTLAQAYIPSDMVDTLQLDLHTPMSQAYSASDSSVNTLMSMINPAIPILPGANMDDSTGTAAYDPEATAPNKKEDGAPIGGDSGSSQSVKGSSVGIGIGAVCGAAAYAAAMVYVARRYREKKRSHQRTSSVAASGPMTETSPRSLSGGGMGSYFMSGGNGLRGSGTTRNSGRGSRNSAGSSNNRSVREQGISAPIMAENSLGWS